MIVAVYESSTIQQIVSVLFEHADPDYPKSSEQTANHFTGLPIGAQSTLSIEVARRLTSLLNDVVSYLEGDDPFLNGLKSFEKDLVDCILEDDNLIAILASGWSNVTVLDNRGTFILTY